MRIEDTDLERNNADAVQGILDAMDWLGLNYDEGPIYQTNRLDRYRTVAEGMVAAGTAYYAYETKDELAAARDAAIAAKEKPRYSGAYRDRNEPRRDDPNRVIRFKNPLEGTVVFEDKVKGRIEIANSELDDLVILRGGDIPTYNFAVVVDDWDMGITDVVRGDDHVNNTPRQINIYHALGAPVPYFSHLPMILNEGGEKLSKRRDAADVMQYRGFGYLPHALLNYLARLGWSHGDQEIFSIEEMINLFQLQDVNSKAARMDMAKLGWLNQQYLKSDDPIEVGKHLQWHLLNNGYDLASGPAPADVVIALRDRVQTLKDMAERAAVWYRPLEHYDEAAVAKHLNAAAQAPLSEARARLAALAAWTAESVSAALHEAAEALGLGMGKVAQPLRVAITGTQVSPDISHTVYLAGQAQALQRIDAALTKIPA